MLMQALFRIAFLNFSHHPGNMADELTPVHDEYAEAVRKAEEMLKTAKERQQKAEEAVEEKRKADEAAKNKRKAEEAEKEKAAQSQAEKEEAERIRAANEAMQVGVAEHMAEVQRTANDAAAARAKEQALATRRKKLVKLGAAPDNPLMQAPEGSGPSRQEVREVQREFLGKPKKWKVRETEMTVCFPNFRSRTC
jgi:membrane protein involved in colicin uptake